VHKHASPTCARRLVDTRFGCITGYRVAGGPSCDSGPSTDPGCSEKPFGVTDLLDALRIALETA